MRRLLESELVLTSDNRIYHLELRPKNLADDVLLVGDPDRVAMISHYFDKIEFTRQHREFITHTGTYRGKRLTAMSTGIGIGCIDIVMTELDALASINFETRELLPKRRKLNIVRLGTSGALQADVPVGSLVATTHAIGMDGLLDFYKDTSVANDRDLSQAFVKQTSWPDKLPYPYAFKASPELLKKFDGAATFGMTASALGFYGPQGREIRLQPAVDNLNGKLANFEYQGNRIVNYEMEASAIYGLSTLLGHNHLTVCVAVANRATGEFVKNGAKSVDNLIKTALDRLTA